MALKMCAIPVLLLLSLICVDGARILAVFPFPAHSHYILGNAFLKELAKRGHDVTMISSFREKNPPKEGSYRDVVVTDALAIMEEHRKGRNMFDSMGMHNLLVMPFMGYLLTSMAETVLNDTNLQNFLKEDNKYDVVIVEQFFTESLKGLAHHFDAPLVLFSSVGSNYWTNVLVGNPAPPAYVPDSLLEYSGNMTFWQRVANFIMYLENEIIHKLYMFPKHNQFMKKYLPNPPELDDINYNASLVLLNSFPGISQPVPHVPNMIEVGGFHIQPPEKLPEDLQQFLDNAKEGVIYFSMGSNLKSADLPQEKLDAFLRAFSKLKQKVLWKWEKDSLPGQPENVQLGKWFPQQSVLAHPNVKLFITHGGWLSTTETVYFGVPILAIPVYGDQNMNAQKSVEGGYALSIPFHELNEENLTEKLIELLQNSKYSAEAKKRSTLFHDRLVKPMDTLIYWVEYVIRHGGASHLRVAGVDLPLYKYLSLDIILFLAVIVFLYLHVSFWVLKKIGRKLLGKLQKSNKNKRD